VAVLSPPAAALIMSQFSTFGTTLFATCVFGLLSSLYMPSTQAAVMKATPDQFRGRVAALISLTQNLGSVGVLLYALVADPWGIRAAYLVFGSLAAGLQILYFMTMRSYRELR
jgi:MFS family permease